MKGRCVAEVYFWSSYLGEDPSTATAKNGCCDVCSNVCEVADYQKEVSAIVRVVQEIQNCGERKLSEWIRGSRSDAVQKILETTPNSSTHGIGTHFNLSLEGWRKFLRASWIVGLLEREMIHGAGESLKKATAMNVFTPSSRADPFLQDPSPVLLPPLKAFSKSVPAIESSASAPKKRNSKGCQALPMIRDLLSNPDFWFEIKGSEDYQYPGIFTEEYPKRLGYCADISQLGMFTPNEPDFLYYNIQFGKGKPRNPQQITIFFGDESSLDVTYRIAPCRGVKLCGSHAQGCGYVTSTRENRPCPDHPKLPLVCSGECPVEFLHVKPTDDTDNRRWQTGFVRTSKEFMKRANIHSHPTPPGSKIPCKILNDIQNAVTENPHLKTSDLVEGRGIGYIPSAVSLAAASNSKVKHVRNSALRQSGQNGPSIACILDFEKQATKHDKQMRLAAGSHEAEHMDEYQHCGRPYLLRHYFTSDLTVVVFMSPWMSEKFSRADFIEPDVIFGVSAELPYLLNIVTFDYSTCKCSYS